MCCANKSNKEFMSFIVIALNFLVEAKYLIKYAIDFE